MDSSLKNKVIHKSCIEFLRDKNSKIFDHVITDIPYDVVSRKSAGIRVFDKDKADELTFDLDIFCTQLSVTTKGNILIFCASEQVSELDDKFGALGYNTYLGIWEKTNPSPVNGQYFWLSGVECCFIASHEILKDDDLVWKFPNGRSKEHPTEKPVKLIEALVSKFTSEDQLIYDPCAGSGAHLIACKNLKRNYFGTELFEEYFKLIKSRGL